MLNANERSLAIDIISKINSWCEIKNNEIKYAGSFVEEITSLCFKYKYPKSKKEKVPNTEGKKPKTFEIDCLVQDRAYEIKWRDATTDGDHITKEHTRIKAIKKAGYKPIRIMFYYPEREQAKKIQGTLKTLYKSTDIDGEYYAGDQAWDYLKNAIGVDLKNILVEISKEKVRSK